YACADDRVLAHNQSTFSNDPVFESWQQLLLGLERAFPNDDLPRRLKRAREKTIESALESIESISDQLAGGQRAAFAPLVTLGQKLELAGVHPNSALGARLRKLRSDAAEARWSDIRWRNNIEDQVSEIGELLHRWHQVTGLLANSDRLNERRVLVVEEADYWV